MALGELSIDGLRALVRDVPDFPKPGIMFKDITPLIGNADGLASCVARLAALTPAGVEAVVAIESRGFLFGAPLALRLGLPVIPVRKPGKLPYHKRRVEYALEYGTDALEMHADALAQHRKVIIVDDVLATGGTAAATAAPVPRRRRRGRRLRLRHRARLPGRPPETRHHPSGLRPDLLIGFATKLP